MLLSTVEVPEVVGRKWVRMLSGMGRTFVHGIFGVVRSRAMRTEVVTMWWQVWLESEEKRSGEWWVLSMSMILSLMCCWWLAEGVR